MGSCRSTKHPYCSCCICILHTHTHLNVGLSCLYGLDAGHVKMTDEYVNRALAVFIGDAWRSRRLLQMISFLRHPATLAQEPCPQHQPWHTAAAQPAHMPPLQRICPSRRRYIPTGPSSNGNTRQAASPALPARVHHAPGCSGRSAGCRLPRRCQPPSASTGCCA
jgi:hypothetical protein